MLGIREIKNDKGQNVEHYFEEEGQLSSYYLKDELGSSDKWCGGLAPQLGLNGAVEPDDFVALCRNKHPKTEKNLTERNRADRRIGYDVCFSAPKSLSVLVALKNDSEILEAFKDCVRETMDAMEKEVRCRVRAGGVKDGSRVSGNWVYSEHTHFTSRPSENSKPDPQLHCHCVTFNVTVDQAEDGKIKAYDISHIKRDGMYWQAYFHSKLALKIKDLGYSIERGRNGTWEIEGVDKDILKTFSKRTDEIERKAQELGITDPEAKADLGRKTRSAKQEYSIPELKEDWEGQLTEKQLRSLDNVKAKATEKPKIRAHEAYDFAVKKVFERASVVQVSRLKAEALKRGVGDISPEQVEKIRRKEVLTAKLKGQDMCTTRGILSQEREYLETIRNGQGTRKALWQGKEPYQVKREYLNDGQRKAIGHILSSNNAHIAFEGAAGVGKTSLLQEVQEAVTEQGNEFFGVAPTASARDQMISKGFEASTVQKLLIDKKLQDRVLKSNTLLSIDESGLLSSSQFNQLIQLGKERNIRMVFSGDTKQNHSIQQGDAFRIALQSGALSSVRVNQIVRQKNEDYRRAVELIDHGEIDKGWSALKDMDAVKELKEEKLYDEVAKTYHQLSKGNNDSVLVVCPIHADGKKITEKVRALGKEDDSIGAKDREMSTLVNLNLTEAEKQDVANYEPGLKVVFNRSTKGFKSGAAYEVVGVTDNRIMAREHTTKKIMELPIKLVRNFSLYSSFSIALARGDKIRMTMGGKFANNKGRFNSGAVYAVRAVREDGSIELSNGKVVPKDFKHYGYGIYDTAIGAQGKDKRTVLNVFSQRSLPALSDRAFYVGISRGTYGCQVLTDNSEALLNKVKRSSHRTSASELMASRKHVLKYIDLHRKFQSFWKGHLDKAMQYGHQSRENLAFINRRILSLTPNRNLNHGYGERER